MATRRDPPAGPVLCSTATVARGLGGRSHSLVDTLAALGAIPADAFELVLLPEWAADVSPPLVAPRTWAEDHQEPPEDRCSLAELLTRVRSAGVAVTSVHAHRDLGVFLCSADRADRAGAAKLLAHTVDAARALGATMVIVHGWDTYAERLDLSRPLAVLEEAAGRRAAGPGVHSVLLAVENIPIRDPDWCQEEAVAYLLERLPDLRFCLDLSWASLYDNLEPLLEYAPRLANVHVQGRLEGTVLRPREGRLDLRAAIQAVRAAGYAGPYTLELNRPPDLAAFGRALAFIRSALGAGAGP